MKLLVISAFLVFLILPIAGQKRLREVDLRISGVGSGSSYSTVVRKIGKPVSTKTEKYDSSESCSGVSETLTLKYAGLELSLLREGLGKKLRVYAIDVTSRKWLASGLRVGANTANVRKRFGQPNSQAVVGGKLIYYYVTPGNLGGVNFEFKNGKLARILMTETLC